MPTGKPVALGGYLPSEQSEREGEATALALSSMARGAGKARIGSSGFRGLI